MRYALCLLAALGLSACSNTPAEIEFDICLRATDGLTHDKQSKCVEDIGAARYNAWHDAAQPYRNMQRGRAD